MSIYHDLFLYPDPDHCFLNAKWYGSETLEKVRIFLITQKTIILHWMSKESNIM